MGLRFKKSFDLGAGFKVNLSKSGIGYSWGVLGFRKTKLCNGRTRTTFNVPGTGISYIKETGAKKTKDKNISQSKQEAVAEMIEEPIVQFEETNEDEFIEQLEQIKNKYFSLSHALLSYFILGGAVFVGLVLSIILPDIWAIIIASIFFFSLFNKNNNKYKLKVNYNLDGEYKNFYDDVIYALEILNSCDKVWYKRWYGDMKLTLKKKSPGFIKSNIDLYCVSYSTFLENVKFYFLPDRVMRLSDEKSSFFKYNDFKYHVAFETSSIQKARDANIVKQEWKHANKDGSKDHRWKKNSCKTTYRYAQITVNDRVNEPFVFYCSDVNKVNDFQRQISYIKRRYNIFDLQQVLKPVIIPDHEEETIISEKLEETVQSGIVGVKEVVSNPKINKKSIVELKNELEFYIFYDGAVRYMKIKQYSDFKAELFEFTKDGTFIEVKIMPVLSGFMNKYIAKKPANTRHAADLFIKFIKTSEGKAALEEWNHITK